MDAPSAPERWAEFHGPNAAHVLDLYERYVADPSSVDEGTRAYFESRAPSSVPYSPTPTAAEGRASAGIAPGTAEPPLPRARRRASASEGGAPRGKVVAAVNLANSIRDYGHLGACLDPLGCPSPGDPALLSATFGLTDDDLRALPASVVGGPLAASAASAHEAILALRSVYGGTLGYDYLHLRAPEERAWLRHAAESRRFRPELGPFSPVRLLERLTQVEVFERFLGSVFPGKTRFSIEGLDMLVPMLDQVLLSASEAGISSLLIGMAHRGRLNVLAHVLNKPYAQMFAEFKDPAEGKGVALRDDLGWTGDVKYHAGACRALGGPTPASVVVTMVPNPSHLEFVNPVVGGMARAAGTWVGSPGPPTFHPAVSLPLIIHGDASFPGQGVVAETLNFSRLPGYRTGGTIHIIANNQLGFTTDPRDSRSTLYASDLAKGFEIPIVHVNADDPVACLEGIRLACAYRAKFLKDFLVDLVGYRRHGHNEGDEPRFTHPRIYSVIDRHPTVREIWARTLVERGTVEPTFPGALVRERQGEFERVLASVNFREHLVEPQAPKAPPGAARKVKTAIGEERLRRLHSALMELPPGFKVHPRLERVTERRRKALDDPDAPAIDWGLAEALAMASILEDGTSIRFTGEDVERGTFSHRHARLHDAETGKSYVPLQSFPGAKAAFEIVNSPLTECAAVGFEYGYAVQTPERLVIWEAQYGDFINGAQVIVDEYVATARAKWGQTPSLVLLLPHGHEGQGPDHSSARLERFLGLASDVNMRIAYPTTAAQYYHLLRRQASLLRVDPLPLIVMTPKSLLRHPGSASSLRELADGIWQPIIDDGRARSAPEAVRRLILVSGKVYYDLMASKERETTPSVAIVRVEQIYPLHPEVLDKYLVGFPNLQEVVWLQEEPENMGAWRYRQYRIQDIIAGRWPLKYIGRPISSSPAEGSAAWHAINQQAIVDQAFRSDPSSSPAALAATGRP